MSSVVLEKIVKKYGAFEVVHGIDLEIAAKEFVVLVGPSGCGKSTTLRMIAGLEEISGGTLTIGDRVMNRVAPKDRDVAMVFQNYALYPHLSVSENIAFGLRIRKVKKEQIAESVADVAGILGLTDYLDRRPADLSGGQRQRVAMGRAIVRHPEVFLFDEPLSNLDAKLRTQMRAEIKRLHKRLGVTSVYVTHDQVEAMTLADRIVVMCDGRIEQIGTPMDLFNNPINTFVAGFIGSPPMNQIDAKLTYDDKGPLADIDGVAVRLPALPELKHNEGRKIVVGMRPEHMSITPIDDASELPVTLDLIETLGSEALLHTMVAGKPFVAKAETNGKALALEDVTSLRIAAKEIKVFDGETGMAFGHPGTA
ncbi:carbohydrate ABC transporter ATP-binding protein, CUT1 family (TC 3.A.1.1.-) [Yoonia tamlensis]|uniref:Carbohydrate ABC transporter ATP-binding protein, CUT1 family (TC 3.A.1.1.-) n=1 Tax=Yoonia tamlensis TaxID=390270 RepID=A0A1I6HFB2_9RHOB|nr:sn-glycerol-3-phosphate ABC transporter ATP-binding protein UgpC [Yoonia tamlensis]SFR53195.1 carbohydrate ABC transporter ATP-binding protein, CUT1 family (TC 3.A.1.1.-) [Yoonia tamlensis]